MRAARLLRLALAALCCCFAQQQNPPDLLEQFRQKMAESETKLPRYLCSQSLHRQVFRLPPNVDFYVPCEDLIKVLEKQSKHLWLASEDRLRLDVAMIDHDEAYSWVGEDRFSDQSIHQLLQGGMSANGSFDAFIHAVLFKDQPTFIFQGISERNGRRVARYDFSAALKNSSYLIANKQVAHVVAYTGHFTFDEQTFQLLDLEIAGVELPPDLGACQVLNTLDYAQLKINNANVLLPSQTINRLIDTEGQLQINTTNLAGCHEFLGESKLIFSDTKAGTEIASVTAPQTQLPAGLNLDISLAERINPAIAAAGDLIRGRLEKPIEVPSLNLNIPVGTILRGRIWKLVSSYGQDPVIDLGLKWESLQSGGQTQPLVLSLTGVVSKNGTAGSVYVQHPELKIGSGAGNQIGYLSIAVAPKHHQIPFGLETLWVTLPPPPTANK